jgi:hypothetical protein
MVAATRDGSAPSSIQANICEPSAMPFLRAIRRPTARHSGAVSATPISGRQSRSSWPR